MPKSPGLGRQGGRTQQVQHLTRFCHYHYGISDDALSLIGATRGCLNWDQPCSEAWALSTGFHVEGAVGEWAFCIAGHGGREAQQGTAGPEKGKPGACKEEGDHRSQDAAAADSQAQAHG